MKKLLCIILLALCLTANVSHSQSFKMFGQLLSGQFADGLVFYWRGIEAVEAVDESRQGNNGTIIGATWVGDGLVFDGSGDYVSLGSPSVFDFGTSDCTIVVRIRMNSTATDSGIVTAWGLPAASEEQWALLFESINPHVKWAFSNTATQFFVADSPDNGIVVGQWYQIVGVREGNVLKIYVDAVVSADQPTITGTVEGYPGVRIGDLTRGGGSLNGLIRDVSIYNRALSASEIAALSLNPALPMQQPPIWLLQPPPAVVTGQVIIITKHEKQSTIMSILSALWEGIWALV